MLEARRGICEGDLMEEKPAPEDLLRAFGPEKEAWKAAGNYFTAEELRRMEKDFADLRIEDAPDPIYAAD